MIFVTASNGYIESDKIALLALTINGEAEVF